MTVRLTGILPALVLAASLLPTRVGAADAAPTHYDLFCMNVAGSACTWVTYCGPEVGDPSGGLGPPVVLYQNRATYHPLSPYDVLLPESVTTQIPGQTGSCPAPAVPTVTPTQPDIVSFPATNSTTDPGFAAVQNGAMSNANGAGTAGSKVTGLAPTTTASFCNRSSRSETALASCLKMTGR